MPRSVIVLLLLASAAAAQSPAKRPLEHRDSDIWNTTTGMTLAPNGEWIAYQLAPPEGDAEVVVKNVVTGTETRFFTARPAEAPAGSPPPAAISGGIQFSPDSKRLFVSLTPVAERPEGNGKPKPAAKPALAVIELANGKVVERVPQLRSFRVVGKSQGYLVTQSEPRPAEAVAVGGLVGGALTPPGVLPRSPADLKVRRLAGGELVIPSVAEFTLTKDETLLLATRTGSAGELLTVALPQDGELPKSADSLVKKPGRFSRLTFDEPQERLAFFHTAPAEKPGDSVLPTVHVWDRTGKSVVELLGTTPAGLPKDSTVVERGGLSFSTDGQKLELFTAPKSKDAATQTATAPPAERRRGVRPTAPGTTPTAAANPDSVDLDLWHWKDDAIQPMQKVRAATDRNKTYRAVYLFKEKQFKPLSTDDLDVPVPNFGDWAVARSDRAYRGQLWRYPSPRDYSLVNIRTGEQRPLLTEFEGAVVAPFGNHAVAFDGTDWVSHEIPTGKKFNLTGALGVRLDNEDFDLPAARPPHGLRGWTADQKHVIVADRHDLWKLAFDGSGAENLTKVGRPEGLEFNIVPIGEDFSTLKIDLSKPLLLSVTHTRTLDTGFYRLSPGRTPEKLILEPRRFSQPTESTDGTTWLFTAQTFANYPDYYVADRNFAGVKRVTDLQPRTREFTWGTSELVRYTSTDGLPLQGVLIRPENFDPAKKYPMIVYLYERLSDSLHSHRLPTAGTSINPTFYASRGYLILMPDIAYTAGTPGQSALKCVLPAIQAVVNQGGVDEAAIGIQGHSWGGYQAAYMVTQTRRFAAAAAGAPVSNMVSAYGGVRWGSGLPRQFQYEKSQSRIGKTLWEAPTRYIENSPIFYADQVATPLLMLHNDQDDAVPWYQGIELYLALRRLGKEVYLLNYVGQPHGLRKKSAQRDYTARMQQFFDHHLKGAPAPAWMANGVPYAERDGEKDAIKKLFEPPGKKK